MSLMQLTVDVEGPMRGLVELADTQLPFALAVALTRTAKQGQAVEREEEGRLFQLRNDWTVRNTKIAPATKQTLTSAVFTDTSNRITGAPDYLEGQEDGRERVPIEGRHHIAIPTKYLRLMIGNKPIPDWLRPKNLLGLAPLKGQYVNRRGDTVKQSVQTRGYYFFLVSMKHGGHFIGTRAANDAREAMLRLYNLVDSAHIAKRLNFAKDIQDVVDGAFAEEFARAIAETRINDALREAGLSIKI